VSNRSQFHEELLPLLRSLIMYTQVYSSSPVLRHLHHMKVNCWGL